MAGSRVFESRSSDDSDAFDPVLES